MCYAVNYLSVFTFLSTIIKNKGQSISYKDECLKSVNLYLRSDMFIPWEPKPATNTSPRLVRKNARIFFTDIAQTFSACIQILIAFLNRVRKSRLFLTMQQRRQINFYNNIREKYYRSLSFSNHFTFDFCLHQFSITNLTPACLHYTSDEKNTAFQIQILPTVKFTLHIPISLLSLKNWEAVTKIIDGVHFSMCDS